PRARGAGGGRPRPPHGSGDLPLSLIGEDRIAFMHLWPHVRPWQLARPEPMLRAVPNAQCVAQLLTDAWAHSTGQPAVAVSDVRAMASNSNSNSAGVNAGISNSAGAGAGAGAAASTAGRPRLATS
ncbi:MAG: hypothetical protein LH480_07775, partial [Rubrivivax sp.]|nr:hypothetical protein [Rubrivivax sp.]